MSRLSQMLIILILCIMYPQINTFSTPLIMDKSSQQSLQSINTDISECSCNLHPSICDNFCCCDTTCAQTQLSIWTSSSLCRNSKFNIQTFCEDLQSKSHFSFEDLGCVYYSNRGNIGYFYEKSTTGAISYPTSEKFVAQTSASQSISLKSSSADTRPYSSAQNLLKITKVGLSPKFIQLWTPVAGGDCGLGEISINQSTSFTCEYPLSIKTCTKSTSHLQGVIRLCKKGDCTSVQALTTVKVAQLDSNLSCVNFITSQTITLNLTSLGSIYEISSISVTITQQNVTIRGNQRYPVKTTINVLLPANAVTYSGNPGYQLGKPVVFSYPSTITTTVKPGIFIIFNSNGNCQQSRTSIVPIIFGQNNVYSCVSNSPCSSSLYIDTIIKQSNLKIQKWATGSSDTISIAGTNAFFSSCSMQTIILNILYTSAGWIEDKQFYVISSQVTTEKATESSWNKKYLKINWIYVDPATITSPPTNNFYAYFSYIWKPLRQYFGVYSE